MSERADSLFNYEDLMVTIELPTTICNEIASASTMLKRAVNPINMPLFWIKPALFHVTLMYTAKVRQDIIPLVVESIGAVLAEIEPFKIRLSGMKLHEEPGHAGESELRGVWIMVTPPDQLMELRQKLKTVLSDLDVEVDNLEFLPHVPIAVGEDCRQTREFQSAFVEWENREFGEVAVAAVLVRKSTPNPANVDIPFAVVANLPIGKEEE